ncbi:CGNR zinc finger domain-containing protein [Streptomyces sp. NPDC002205]|uniref:CGNR zinc finger domain-containing protein n=1 Tax=Streptomyces sp. NPDC002205 TaxID=3154411 RepID=UPI00332DC934
MSDTRLALDLALTVRHDGRGGVVDDLGTPEGLTAWVHERPGLLRVGRSPGGRCLGGRRGEPRCVRSLGAAVRALFAHAVRPGEPSPADARNLMPVREALDRLNAAAAAVPTVPRLDWPDEGAPRLPPPDRRSAVRGRPARRPGPRRDRLPRRTGPDRAALRACHAPRCVRYFIEEHHRQEWCKPSCGNRARVARHHERHRASHP